MNLDCAKCAEINCDRIHCDDWDICEDCLEEMERKNPTKTLVIKYKSSPLASDPNQEMEKY